MNFNRLHKIIAAAVFFIAFFVYYSTAQVSVSFWDCGEFIASSVLLQVPHPPGTPFFLILGRLFSMIPFGEDLAFRVNMISVISSAFTVLFVYLIIVKLIKLFYKEESKGLVDKLGTYLAAATGALSLAFADTFWLV
jgi:surface polysaccharide O-acyltransferase-like enzyme